MSGLTRSVDQLVGDVRYVIRTLRRQPAFVLAAVLTLALGIGLTTAIFSVFNAVVLKPVAYPHPERLVWLAASGPRGPSVVIGPDFVDWREQATSFDAMAAYGNGDYTLVSHRGASRVQLAHVSDDFWLLTGAAPAAGRVPRTGERSAVMVSYAFAQQQFAGDADLIGRAVTLNGASVTIVGVLGERFRFHLPRSAWPGVRPTDVDVYRPIVVSPARSGPVGLYNVVGRLRPAITFDTARAELETINARIAQAHPSPFDDRHGLVMVPMQRQLSGDGHLALQVMLGGVMFVLLIACANVANLLLARASVRRKEIAVRVSIGAGRVQVLRQLFVESLLLAVSGSAVGLLLARVGIDSIVHINPYAIPRLLEARIDGSVLGVMAAASVLTTLLVGLAPAMAVSRLDVIDALRFTRQGGPGTDSRFRRLVVGGQLALAFVLLIGAGLMIKSVWQLNERPTGFEPARILSMTFDFAGPRYADSSRRTAFAEEVLRQFSGEPGVESVSMSTHGYGLSQALTIEGGPLRPPDDLAQEAPFMHNSTSAALPRVLGLRMARGRWFTEGEPAVVLNESLARRDFGGRDPVGHRIRFEDDGPWLTIVGVVEDLRYSKLDAPADAEVYVPYAHGGRLFAINVLVRTINDPMAIATRVRSIVADIDDTRVAAQVMTLERALADSIAPRRLNLALLGTFAATALLLAAIGIYGVVAYAVTQRTYEIGVRMALGAKRFDVTRLVMQQSLLVIAIAIASGTAAALALTRLMEGLLYEVRPTDPAVFFLVAMTLSATAFVACCIPAMRAARVDPMMAMRTD